MDVALSVVSGLSGWRSEVSVTGNKREKSKHDEESLVLAAPTKNMC